MSNPLAVAAAVFDAQAWLERTHENEWPNATRIRAHIALLDAIGAEEVARRFGVPATGETFERACDDYSRAWRNKVFEVMEG